MGVRCKSKKSVDKEELIEDQFTYHYQAMRMKENPSHPTQHEYKIYDSEMDNIEKEIELHKRSIKDTNEKLQKMSINKEAPESGLNLRKNLEDILLREHQKLKNAREHKKDNKKNKIKYCSYKTKKKIGQLERDYQHILEREIPMLEKNKTDIVTMIKKNGDLYDIGDKMKSLSHKKYPRVIKMTKNAMNEANVLQNKLTQINEGERGHFANILADVLSKLYNAKEQLKKKKEEFKKMEKRKKKKKKK